MYLSKGLGQKCIKNNILAIIYDSYVFLFFFMNFKFTRYFIYPSDVKTYKYKYFVSKLFLFIYNIY